MSIVKRIKINRTPRTPTVLETLWIKLPLATILHLYIFLNLMKSFVFHVDSLALFQGLNITVNADNALGSFCRWQERHNPTNESDSQHHDIAILVTR